MTLTSFGRDSDVVVAGGGPVGLMLACELALGGARVTVLERLAEVDQTIKAGALNVPAAEAFYRRGWLPEILEEQQRGRGKVFFFTRQRAPGAPAPGAPAPSAPAITRPPRFAGHFAGMWLSADLVDGTDPDFADRGPAGTGAMISQQAVESLLATRGAELGVPATRG